MLEWFNEYLRFTFVLPSKKNNKHTHTLTHTNRMQRVSAVQTLRGGRFDRGVYVPPKGPGAVLTKQPRINTAHICQGVIKFSHSPDITHPVHTNIYTNVYIFTRTGMHSNTLCAWQGADEKKEM